MQIQTGIQLDEYFNFITFNGEISTGQINEQNVLVCLKSSRGSQVLTPLVGENIDVHLESNITNSQLTVKVNNAVKNSSNNTDKIKITGTRNDRNIDLKLK